MYSACAFPCIGCFFLFCGVWYNAKGRPFCLLKLFFILQVLRHINSYEAEPSHYSRAKHRSRVYLSPKLSCKKMYRQFCENNEYHISYASYYRLFKTCNIRFRKPKSDTCQTCDIFQAKERNPGNYDLELERQHLKTHVDNAALAYAQCYYDATQLPKVVNVTCLH